jgi:AcrR family transcriptional regulator
LGLLNGIRSSPRAFDRRQPGTYYMTDASGNVSAPSALQFKEEHLRMPEAIPAKRGPGRPRDADLRQRRRREILTAAARRFARQGFEATDVQLVADELKVGKGTVYRYFPSKEALFLAAVDQGMQELKDWIDQRTAAAQTSIERVQLGIRAYLEYFDRNAETIELLIQERAHFRYRKRPTYFEHRDANISTWNELFRSMIDEGTIRDVPVERITDVISDLLYGTIFTNHFAARQKTLASQCEDVIDILFRGLLPSGKRAADA